MNTFISPEDSFEVEKAVDYLVKQYTLTGKNHKKPVILHSLRVGFGLLEFGYDKNIVIAGILHDLIEDSAVTAQDISGVFGDDVAKWVDAVSFRSDIIDRMDQYRELFARVVACGREAVVIKAVDLFINSLYIHLVPDFSKQRDLVKKLEYFLEVTDSFIDEPILMQLKDRCHLEKVRIQDNLNDRL